MADAGDTLKAVEALVALVKSGDFDRAIAAAESNRLTHVHWRDWRAKGHGTDEDHEMVGDQAHHEEAIAEYDVILGCLRTARAALAPPPSESTRHCNCPESGTSGSCPFHDSSTIR